ncbi:MAG: penicillin-binding transpeptidase domain-containing protein, partial [Desulfobulbales bacterium]|nr:penicillin-binding transpeptidase domain-containing protein [Desulfobulbales bacterium]
VLVMDANTGGVLAMASYPSFNPNSYWQFSSSALSNMIVSEPVYPGELALIFQQAAAINLRNEKKSQAADNRAAANSLPVLEPEILKRRKLSVAPRIDTVDPEYFARFSAVLGLHNEPETDIPLKDETAVSSATLPTDPSFHTSALRLLTGFTTLMNNGSIVSPHLLQVAYPKNNHEPVKTNLASTGQSALLHPETSKGLVDFLAAKWLKIRSRGRSSATPMFLQAHRFAAARENTGTTGEKADTAEAGEQIPRITQSIMLGAIPGRNPKLTMIALLFYPDNNDDGYPDALEAFGNKFSILAPDRDMIDKMLYVAGQASPVPSSEFWQNNSGALTRNIKPHSPEQQNIAGTETDNKKSMPDVTGKSLRAGLQVLQHLNLDIKLIGSGRIVAQQPAAGAELQYGSPCLLELQQEI